MFLPFLPLWTVRILTLVDSPGVIALFLEAWGAAELDGLVLIVEFVLERLSLGDSVEVFGNRVRSGVDRFGSVNVFFVEAVGRIASGFFGKVDELLALVGALVENDAAFTPPVDLAISRTVVKGQSG